MFRRFEGWLLALGSFVWFGILTPWGRFADPDAFYHAHMASLILAHGPLHAFPWLDLTTFGQHFVDAHFLFHVMLIPAIAFVQAVHPGPFAEFWGAQIMAPILATGTMIVLWWALRQIDRTRAWVWTTLTLLIPGFSTRLLLGKASPVAVGLFVAMIGCAIALASGRRNASPLRAALAITGFLFVLSHGGWIILPLGIGVMMAGEMLFEKFGRDAAWLKSIRSASWNSAIVMTIGIVAGIAVHPNRNELLRFLWVQVIKAGSGSVGSVTQGGEWAPALPSFVVYHLAVFVVAALIAFWGIVVTWTDKRRMTDGDHREQQTTHMKRVVVLAMPLALTLALTLNSRRFIEYLAPAMTLWVAALWTLVDEKRLLESIRELLAGWPRILRRIAPAIALAGAIVICVHQAGDTWSELRRVAGRPFNTWRDTMAAISRRAQPGDRVYNSDWDEFPTLFAADDRLRYVGGLDPVFLEDADPSLSNAVEDLARGRATSTVWNVIAARTGSKFVFITTKRHPSLAEALRSDPRFHELTHDDDTAAYEVLTGL